MSQTPTKQLSKNHFTEFRFKPYSKARHFIKHLNFFYEIAHKNQIPDQAYLSGKNFKELQPTNSGFKVSVLPKLQIPIEMEKKLELLNKFLQQDELKTPKKKIVRLTTPTTRKREKEPKIINFKEFSDMLNSAKVEKVSKCKTCKKITCCCMQKTGENYYRSYSATKKNCKRVYSQNFKDSKKIDIKQDTRFNFFISQKSDDAVFSVTEWETRFDNLKSCKNTNDQKYYTRNLLKSKKIKVLSNIVKKNIKIIQIPYSERPKSRDLKLMDPN